MEVSGRKGLSKQYSVACNPCKVQGSSKLANGFCEECEENMCQSCFDTHRKWKLGHGHTFANLDKKAEKRKGNENLEKCNKHLKEFIKFYCPKHEKVGCGDCMILDHKTCKVEYILDMASTFKDSQEFKKLTEGAKKCHRELKGMLTAIKGNKKQVADINQKFAHDVNKFREEIISHINKLTSAMLKQGEDMMGTDMKKIVELEKEGESLMTELSLLTEAIESSIDKPAKLFVNSINQKPALQQLTDELNSFGDKNKIEIYEFKRNTGIEKCIKECNELGSIHKISQSTEIDVRKDTKPKATKQPPLAQAPVKPQPLLERQLVCRNMNVDGEYLSYADNRSGDVGLYVDKNSMWADSYFEVEILSMGKHGTIAIGLVTDDYSENKLPGYGPDSIGFNAGDGLLYCDGPGTKFGPKCQPGDRIGVGIIDTENGWYDVVFTRNGKKIGKNCRGFRGYPAVGMHSPGEKVKVILDAKMP